MRLFPFLLLLLSFSVYGQKIPIKWGKITPEELSSTTYEYDTEAEAVVLCDYGNLYLVETDRGHDYRLIRTRRIKILKESGLKRGNIFINYYHGEGFEKVKNIDAQVFLPNGKTQSISKSEVFEEKKSKYRSSKNFSIPNLQVGSVFEYRYELNSKDLTHLTDWYFQEDIPIAHSQLDITIPNYYEYIFLLNGYELTQAPKDFNAAEYGSSLKIISSNNPFILKNVPAIKEENFITCIDDYRLGIRFQLNKIHQPNGIIEPILSSWEETAKEMEEHRYLGKQYLSPRNSKKLLAAAQPYLNNANGDQEKIKAACDFLRSNLKSSGYTNFIASDILDRLFEKGEVHSGEINLMLMAILHANDIPVYPLLVSTRDHGRMISQFPIIDQFNHLMVYAVVDGKETILDLGSSFRPIQIPRESSLNKIGWLINGPNSKWIDINVPESKQIIMAKASINEDGILQGSFKGKYSGYTALAERIKFDDNTAGGYWKEQLSDYYPDATIDDFQVKNASEVEKDFFDQFSCTIPEAVQESGDFLYLQPVLYSDFYENPLKQEKRFYPVDIPYPTKEQYIFNFTIPDGYETESLPEPINIVLLERSASYSYEIKQTGNQLVLVSLLQLKELSYSPYEYANMKVFFDQVVDKMKEPVVLKKVQ